MVIQLREFIKNLPESKPDTRCKIKSNVIIFTYHPGGGNLTLLLRIESGV